MRKEKLKKEQHVPFSRFRTWLEKSKKRRGSDQFNLHSGHGRTSIDGVRRRRQKFLFPPVDSPRKREKKKRGRCGGATSLVDTSRPRQKGKKEESKGPFAPETSQRAMEKGKEEEQDLSFLLGFPRERKNNGVPAAKNKKIPPRSFL